jgi:hypothetical protein
MNVKLYKRPSHKTLTRIRKLLRDNPGATVRGKLDRDGVVRYSVHRPRPTGLAALKRYVGLREMQRDAESRYREAIR